MTWGNPPPFVPDPPKKGKKITPEMLAASGSEDGHQMAVFCWAADNCGQYPLLELYHAIPNGGSRHVLEAIKMVGAGLRKGVWDTFLPVPIQTEWAKMYAGLYIEMKEESKRTKKDGGLTAEQIEFGAFAVKMGYYCKVCYNWMEARDTLIAYLEGNL